MMTINIKNSRFLNTKIALIVLFTVLAFAANAQEIIKEKQDALKNALKAERAAKLKKK